MKIQRLSMDNSWRIEFAQHSFLIDPWLFGVEVDYFSWFNKQWHRTKPIAVEEVQRHDFILITQKYPDHFHEPTLAQLNVQKLVLPQSIKRKARKKFPSAQVFSFNAVNGKELCGTSIRLHHFSTGKKLAPVFDAFLLEDGKEALFIASHGISLSPQQIDYIATLPKVKLLICPFNKYILPKLVGGIVSPGWEEAVALAKAINAEYVTATHDEDKHAEGIISKLAQVEQSPSEEQLRQDPFLEKKYIHLEDYYIHQL